MGYCETINLRNTFNPNAAIVFVGNQAASRRNWHDHEIAETVRQDEFPFFGMDYSPSLSGQSLCLAIKS
ncbi:hypothetical protein AZSP09_34650 [Azospira sp. I09]|nr:hypothetical protein AZSP09_34650 [Azospira sp. I09]